VKSVCQRLEVYYLDGKGKGLFEVLLKIAHGEDLPDEGEVFMISSSKILF
jgi:hypothetical protein